MPPGSRTPQPRSIPSISIISISGPHLDHCHQIARERIDQIIHVAASPATVTILIHASKATSATVRAHVTVLQFVAAGVGVEHQFLKSPPPQFTAGDGADVALALAALAIAES